jgi:phosphatidylserine decarboxylase
MSAAAPTPSDDLPPPETPSSAQPGGFGLFVRLELVWDSARRWILRRVFPGHVRRWRDKMKGTPDDNVIDPRDIKFTRNVSQCWFDSTDDVYDRRESLGFARYGFAELIGFSTILGSIFAACSILAVWYSPYFLVPSTIIVFIWLEVLWFFRDPERMVPTDPKAVLSPADGVVTHVETIDEPGMGPNTLRVSIFLSIFNVHGNRVPRAARFNKAQYFRGRFLDARHPDCAKQNEQLWADFIDTQTGKPFRVKQISGAIARRIVCWMRPGEELKAGDRYGMIKFGSRTDLLIPNNALAQVLIKPGDKVRGGVTVLAKTV